MAGDWIPIRPDLWGADEVEGIAELAGLSVDAVVGKLVRVWGWFDSETIDGAFLRARACALDKHADHVGFAEAMLKVGWLKVENGVVVMPNFEHWLGECAKKRMKHAKLTRRQRAQNVRTRAHGARTTVQDSTVKKTTSSCGKPAASKPKIPDPKFRPMVLALEEAVGKCSTKSEHARRSKTVKELLEAGATPDEVRARAERYRRGWPNVTLTDRALVEHWSKFAADAKLGQVPLVEQED